MKKQTAGNNDYLKRARATWNDPIYKEVLRIYNERGHDAAQRYTQAYTRIPVFLLDPTPAERDIRMYGCPRETLDADAESARAGVRSLVLSLLSDAQELISLSGPDYAEDARHLINRAKYITHTYLTGA